MISLEHHHLTEEVMMRLRSKKVWSWKDLLKYWRLAHARQKVAMSAIKLDRKLIITMTVFLKNSPPDLADVIDFSVEHFPMGLEEFLKNYRLLHGYMKGL